MSLPGMLHEDKYQLMERIEINDLSGIMVTENPTEPLGFGIVMWCAYCRTKLNMDHRHMGYTPPLTLMIKMADAHRQTECPNPDGPFDGDWNPRNDRLWPQQPEQEDA